MNVRGRDDAAKQLKETNGKYFPPSNAPLAYFPRRMEALHPPFLIIQRPAALYEGGTRKNV